MYKVPSWAGGCNLTVFSWDCLSSLLQSTSPSTCTTFDSCLPLTSWLQVTSADCKTIRNVQLAYFHTSSMKLHQLTKLDYLSSNQELVGECNLPRNWRVAESDCIQHSSPANVYQHYIGEFSLQDSQVTLGIINSLFAPLQTCTCKRLPYR